MLYSCTHMATVGVKGLSNSCLNLLTHSLQLRVVAAFTIYRQGSLTVLNGSGG